MCSKAVWNSETGKTLCLLATLMKTFILISLVFVIIEIFDGANFQLQQYTNDAEYHYLDRIVIIGY